MELLFQQQCSPKDTAAIIIEPVIGEGGYVPAPPEYMRGLREICDRHGILLIIDEVQTGFLRTGKNFAVEYSGVRPDIMTIAKVCHDFQGTINCLTSGVAPGISKRLPVVWDH